MKAVIFDMDGTLFQTDKILEFSLADTFNYLASLGKWEGAIPIDKFREIMGVPLPEVYGKFTLKPNSLLEYIPDPLIVYREGSYKQLNQFYLDDTSTLIYSDIITPGWSPTGIQFSYDKVDLQNEVFINNELGVFDRIVTEPAKNNLSLFGKMEGYNHLGSMMVISPYVTDELIEAIYENIEQKEVNVGISRCPVPGFSLRILANQTQIIEEILQMCHDYLREKWFGISPVFLRKY